MRELLGKNLSSILPLALLAGGLFVSCDAEESCVALTTRRYNIGFFAQDTTGAKVARSRNFDLVRALGSDSLFYSRREAGVTGLGLALNTAADTTTFVFENDGEADTLRLAYTRNFRLISPDCGLEVRITKPEVVKHTFDSVAVLTEELLTTTKGVDLEIY